MAILVPTEQELEDLFHAAIGYDPAKAHQYYEEHKKLKGRRRGAADDPRTGKTREEIAANSKAKQKKELAAKIEALSERLNKLEALIKKREHEEASEDRKGKAKKERAAKEADKPKSAAEKAAAARESEKYRKEHKQELKNKAKASDKSGGGSSGKKKDGKAKKHSTSELRSLATKVKGQIAVAKQKLAAL